MLKMGAISCTRCILAFNDTDEVYATTCGHLYHKSCMENWEILPNCPQCPNFLPSRLKIHFIYNFERSSASMEPNNLANIDVSIAKLQDQTNDLKTQFQDLQKTFLENSKEFQLKAGLKRPAATDVNNPGTSAKKVKLEIIDPAELAASNQQDANAEKAKRSASIIYYPEAKLSTPLISVVLSLCKFMSLENIKETDIEDVKLYKSMHSKDIKLDVEFKEKRIRDRFLQNRNRLYKFKQLLHSADMRIVSYMSDPLYDICAYAFRYLGVRLLFVSERIALHVIFNTKKDIEEFINRIRGKKSNVKN